MIRFIVECSQATPHQFRISVVHDINSLFKPVTEGFETLGIYNDVDHAMEQLAAYLRMEATA